MIRNCLFLIFGLLLVINAQLLANSPPSYAHWEKSQILPLSEEEQKQMEVVATQYAKLLNPFSTTPISLPLNRYEIITHGINEHAIEELVIQAYSSSSADTKPSYVITAVQNNPELA